MPLVRRHRHDLLDARQMGRQRGAAMRGGNAGRLFSLAGNAASAATSWRVTPGSKSSSAIWARGKPL
jgi:hypothetical protein